MKSPKDMDIIQIDITNACGKACSNCTRFCGHHEKTFFMGFEDFKRAVDSLADYEGMVGIIGGEPTLHPEFERFADYIREAREENSLVRMTRQPVDDMQRYIIKNLYSGDAKVGLWSSLTTGYYKYFETINDTFRTQLLNDHNNGCMHQALLMSRGELGISDEEWIVKRDACWIQNTWSATITPKGAFFCEVAGALDMLFHGPGGWKVEKGWWKREPKDFADQLHWCELCSGCLDVPQRISNDGRDDVTPGMYEKLLELNSPKAKKGMCVVHEPEDYDKSEYHTFTGNTDYIDCGGNIRTTMDNRNLYPKEFVHTNREGLAGVIKRGAKDWILISDDEKASRIAEEYLKNLIINPGCLYEYMGVIAINAGARSLRDRLDEVAASSVNIWNYYPADKIIALAKEQRLNTHLFELRYGNQTIAVYGAGVVGKNVIAWLYENDCGERVRAWADKNYMDKGTMVVSPERLVEECADVVLVAIESECLFKEIMSYLIELGVEADRIKQVPRIYQEQDDC